MTDRIAELEALRAKQDQVEAQAASLREGIVARLKAEGLVDDQFRANWSQDYVPRHNELLFAEREMILEGQRKAIEIEVEVADQMRERGAPEVPTALAERDDSATSADVTSAEAFNSEQRQLVDQAKSNGAIIDRNERYLTSEETLSLPVSVLANSVEIRSNMTRDTVQFDALLTEYLNQHRESLQARIDAAAEAGTDSSREQAALAQASRDIEALDASSKAVSKGQETLDASLESLRNETEAVIRVNEATLEKAQLAAQKRQEAEQLDREIQELRAPHVNNYELREQGGSGSASGGQGSAQEIVEVQVGTGTPQHAHELVHVELDGPEPAAEPLAAADGADVHPV